MRMRTLLGIIPFSLILSIGCSEAPQYSPNKVGQGPREVPASGSKSVGKKKAGPKILKNFTEAPDGITP